MTLVDQLKDGIRLTTQRDIFSAQEVQDMFLDLLSLTQTPEGEHGDSNVA